MHRIIVVALAVLSGIAAASIFHPPSSDPLGSEILDVIEYAVAIAGNTFDNCQLSLASLPVAPDPLPPPSSGLTLHHIAIGRGTQNYTCPDNSTVAPVAVGALASLFNVTCLTVDTPDLVANLSEIAINLPLPFSPAFDEAAKSFDGYSGIHYFRDTTTPFFNLDTDLHRYGYGAFRKAAASVAPAGSINGPHGQGHGAAPWLKLTAKPGYGNGSQPLKEVYRVHTAGGQAPATCLGQQAEFEIPYTAQYWFYA